MGSLLWSALLLLGALAAVGIEMFLPSAGLLGVIAAALFLSAIIVAFFHSALAGVCMIAAIGLLLPLIFLVFVNVWPHTPIGRRVLIDRRRKEDLLPTGEAYDELQQLVGRRGTARTPMLPSGQILIDGEKYDAVSQGGAIEIGDRVEVVAIRTYKIIVRRVADDEPEQQGLDVDPDDILSQPVDDLFS
jgi:membrane-bound ClpP family serine protease